MRKDAAASALDRALREFDVRRDVLASDLGVCVSKLTAWTTVGSGQSIPASDLPVLPADVLRALIGPALERHGLALVTLPAASSSSCVKAAARLAREIGDVIGDAYEASADGEVTPAEGAKIEREADEALSALLEVRDAARAAQLVPVRRIGAVR